MTNIATPPQPCLPVTSFVELLNDDPHLKKIGLVTVDIDKLSSVLLSTLVRTIIRMSDGWRVRALFSR